MKLDQKTMNLLPESGGGWPFVVIGRLHFGAQLEISQPAVCLAASTLSEPQAALD